MYNIWPVGAQVKQHFKWYEVSKLIQSLNTLTKELTNPESLANDNCPMILPVQNTMFDFEQRFPSQGTYFCDCEDLIMELINICNKIIDLNYVDEPDTDIYFNYHEIKEDDNDNDGDSDNKYDDDYVEDESDKDDDFYCKEDEQRKNHSKQLISCIQNILFKISHGHNTFDQKAFEEYFNIKWS